MFIEQFAYPSFFWLLALLPLAVIWIWKRSQSASGLLYSTITEVGYAKRSWRILAMHLPDLMRFLVLILGIIALARPQRVNTSNERFAEGIDIVIAMDISTSMKAMDFKPDRFTAAKEVAARFIASRISDRVGIVVFAGQAFTQAPLTLDYNFLQSMLSQVQMGIIQDGTAIGSGLVTALNRLKDSKAKSKVVILLTDGLNNAGEVDPQTAGDVAANLGIRVYTIGVGAKGKAPFPIDDLGGRQIVYEEVRIDEEMMQGIAKKTNGRYFRATDESALETIYQEISQLEKTKIEQRIYTDYEELFPYFVGAALLLLLLENILRATWLRTFP